MLGNTAPPSNVNHYHSFAWFQKIVGLSLAVKIPLDCATVGRPAVFSLVHDTHAGAWNCSFQPVKAGFYVFNHLTHLSISPAHAADPEYP